MPVEATDNAKAIVDKAVSSIGDIATLPEVTIRIIEVVEDPTSTARDLHDIIKNDPALSVKVLKVVNSAFYGLPGQVASVDRAIILLGLSAVKNIAIAASIARLFKGRKISRDFSAADLWRHSVAVAVASHGIAKASSHPAMANEIFVAGMIHDIGTLVERQAFPDPFARAIDRCVDTGRDFLECERETMGADHQAFGVGLTTKWKFPRHLRAAVGFHHNPQDLSSELRNVSTAIHVADALCCQEKIGFHLTHQNGTFGEESLDLLGITPAEVEEIRAGLADHISEAELTLGA